jgi:hypothetical protein
MKTEAFRSSGKWPDAPPPKDRDGLASAPAGRRERCATPENETDGNIIRSKNVDINCEKIEIITWKADKFDGTVRLHAYDCGMFVSNTKLNS